MAINLDAIKAKLANLKGGNMSSIKLWKPTEGEYKIRILPWRDLPDGSPFVERHFYYIGDGPGIVAPYQFNEPDPIRDLSTKLWATKDKDDREMAKKLSPKLRAYAPVIVRGEEAAGVQVWAFGKQIYERLLGFFVDSEIGDITDPKDGFDLKITITKQPGKKFVDTAIDAARRSSPLSQDKETMTTWLEEVPDLSEFNKLYKLKTYDEITNILNAWASGDSAPDETKEQEKGGKVKDELADLEADVAVKPQKSGKKKSVEEINKELDDEFADLTK